MFYQKLKLLMAKGRFQKKKLVEKKNKKTCCFLGFSAHLWPKIFLNFFTLKISNLSYSVGHRGRCWLVVGGSYWWLVTVQWVGGWPWLVCIGWWVGSDLSSQFYIYFVQCCLTQCLTWPHFLSGHPKSQSLLVKSNSSLRPQTQQQNT